VHNFVQGDQSLRTFGLAFILSSVLFASSCLLSGCGVGNTSEPAITVTPSQAVLSAGQSLQFNAAVIGVPVPNPQWLVNGIVGGSASIGTISGAGLYTAPTRLSSTNVQISATDPAKGSYSAPVSVSFFDPDNFQPGVVSATINPLVASYTLAVPQGASMQVQFGTTTNYGLTTWEQTPTVEGGNITILVAGMRAGSTYHMRAILQLPDGKTVEDSDHLFTTGTIPSIQLPNITTSQAAGMAPADGVELLDLFQEVSQNTQTAVVTDLQGNIIWYYPLQDEPFPIKLLPNGHMLVVESQHQRVQEIDLAGNVIWQLTLGQIQQRLSEAGINWPLIPPSSASSSSNGLTQGLNHDILELPNGHLILLVDYTLTLTNQPGSPAVLGDAIIDWDLQKGPVWTWSSFDHLSLAHAPYGTSDWTHANALLYSPDDGDLLLSMRNQNWVIKINYSNGEGDGKILWHFGEGGDFTLPPGEAPTEWNYGQHYISFPGADTVGIFPFMFFNNGNGRLDSNNVPCGTKGGAVCYSSVPVFQLNEYTHNAEVLSEHIPISPNGSTAFSSCCGSADFLSNGDLEYDVAFDQNTPGVSYIQELTQEQTPQLVWQMIIKGQLAYRAFRIPSLYPGVSWSESAIATANAKANAQPLPIKAGKS